MSFRRVIAAERNGSAVLVADEKVERLDAAGIDPIWRSASVPEVPNLGYVSDTVGFPIQVGYG